MCMEKPQCLNQGLGDYHWRGSFPECTCPDFSWIWTEQLVFQAQHMISMQRDHSLPTQTSTAAADMGCWVTFMGLHVSCQFLLKWSHPSVDCEGAARGSCDLSSKSYTIPPFLQGAQGFILLPLYPHNTLWGRLGWKTVMSLRQFMWVPRMSRDLN